MMSIKRVVTCSGQYRRTICGKRSLSSLPPPSKPPTPTPPTPTMDIPKALTIGSIAGVLGSLAGMGGGFVMIPMMTSRSLLNLSQHQAHGSSLFAVAATGVAGALGYSGQVQWDAAAAIAMTGMMTARLGAATTAKLSGPTLKRALGIFMICIAPTVPAKAYIMGKETGEDKDLSSTAQNSSNSESDLLKRLIVPASIGLGSGYLAGLFGVGGGAIVVPALTLLTDMNHYQALGTSLCAMSLPAVVGTVTHFQKGNVAMRIAPALAMGSFVGAYFGGKVIGLHTDENTLRWGFSGLMLFLGSKAIFKF